jgi:cytochrome P450
MISNEGTTANPDIASSGSADGLDFYRSAVHPASEVGPSYRQLRAAHRIAWADAHGGYWVASRYRDVEFVLQTPALFSSRSNSIPRHKGYVPTIPFTVDPPAHREYRRVIGPLLSPTRLKPLNPFVHSCAQTLLSSLMTRTRFEFVQDFCVPMVARVFFRVMGFPPNDEALFIEKVREFLHRISVAATTPPYGDDSLEDTFPGRLAPPPARVALEYYVLDQVRQGAAGLDRGIFPALARTEWKTHFWDRDREMISILTSLLGAGLSNTTSTLANMIVSLASQPDHRAYVAAHPEAVPAVVEELLRLHPPVSPARVVVRDVEMNGVKLNIGDSVLPLIPSAGRDEEVFEHPDEFRPGRVGRPHLSFGVGLHWCTGAYLARQVLSASLIEMHRLMPEYAMGSQVVSNNIQRTEPREIWLEH